MRLVVDLSIPTDRQLTERRPDLVAYYRELRRIVIFEIACAWEPLIEERQREKGGKYRELAADLATHNLSCSYLPGRRFSDSHTLPRFCALQ